MEDVIRKNYKIYGRVQGVGFRYRAKYAADSLGVTGWVRNEEDGTVEMEAQGSRAQLEKLFVTINKSSYIVMDRIDGNLIEIKEYESGFDIR